MGTAWHEASAELEVLAEHDQLRFLERDGAVRKGWVSVAATLGAGVKVSAGFAGVAEREAPYLFEQLFIHERVHDDLLGA
jgi:hypothetical protein